MTPPQCAWCDAADSLTEEWAEMGTVYYHCGVCSHRTRVDPKGLEHRAESRGEMVPEERFR